MSDPRIRPDIPQFRRFLYFGGHGSLANSAKFPFRPSHPDFLEVLGTEDFGKEAVRELLHFYRDDLYLCSDTLIYALAACSHSKDTATKHAASEAAREICVSGSSLISYASFCKDLSKPTNGCGRHHRRFISDWYNEKSPKDLAVEVTKTKSRHKWSHKDVLCVCHVKPKNAGTAAVLRYIIKGIKEAEKEFGTQPEVEPVLSYLNAVEELKHTTDPHTAARLIEMHDLSIEHIPSVLLKTKEVLLCLIPRIKLHDLLDQLPRMCKIGLLKMNSPHYKAVLERLNSENVLANESVGPMESLLALRRWQEAHKPVPGKPARQRTPAIDDALQNLHLSSFSTMVPTGKRFLIATKLSMFMHLRRCYGCSALSPYVVSELLITALSKVELSNVTTVVFSSGGLELYEDVKNKTTAESMDEYMNIESAVANLSSPIHWAIENKKEVDVFLIITDGVGNVDYNEVSSLLKEYRNTMNVPNARYLVCALRSTTHRIPAEEGMFDLIGFNTKLLKIIQDFACGVF